MTCGQSTTRCHKQMLRSIVCLRRGKCHSQQLPLCAAYSIQVLAFNYLPPLITYRDLGETDRMGCEVGDKSPTRYQLDMFHRWLRSVLSGVLHIYI